MSQIEQSIKLNGQRNDHSLDDPLNAVNILNQRSIERLIRAVEISQGEFALIIVHCNYSHLRQNILNELANATGLLYREIWWRVSDAPIYQKLQDFIADCHYPVPALMCLGLEHFGTETTDTSIHIFAEINLFRDRLKHQLKCPLVLWLSDENLSELWQQAPDFASFAAPPLKFTLSTLELIQELDQQVERLFQIAQDPLISLFWQDQQIDNDPDILSYQEIEVARRELRIAHHHEACFVESNDRHISLTEEILQSQFHKSCAELQAKLDLAMGRLLWRSPRLITNYTNDVYVESQGEVHSVSQIYYECSLLHWRKVERPVEEGIVLFYLGNLWWHNSFVRGRATQDSWQRAKQYFQEAIACFQRAQREDLVAKYGRAYSGVLEQLQQWQELTDWIHQLLPLHRLNPLELAQDYGYLAKAAISRGAWRDVLEQASQALSILESRILFDSPLNGSHNNSHEPNFEQHCQRLQQIQIGQCQLLIAQSQYRLGEIDVAIAIMELTIANFNCQDEPHLYIRMLDTFHDLAFAKGLYLQAFHTRQQQRSLEQQYGLRAFIGAGSLQPKQLVSVPDINIEPSKLAQQKTEIAASGRTKDVEYLIHRICNPTAQQLTVIHGESGVGKSSLVNAGLIPALWQRSLMGFAILPIKISIYTNWLQVIANTLQSSAASIEQIMTKFKQLADQGTQIVLIFDQFEEFFFTNTQSRDRQIFRQFWQNCLDKPYLKLVISIREDYLHLLLELETANAEIDILSRDLRYALANLSPADTTALIENLTQQANFPLEPALIECLVQDLAGDRGSVRPIELQLVGSQLQDRSITTLAAYQAAGGKQKLVEQSVQEVIQACGDAAFVAQQVLLALTDERGKRPLRNYNELRNFILPYTSNSLDLDLVLEILVGSGLIFQLPESLSNRYQLVHDYLVPFIRANQESELLGELQKVRSVAETRRVRLARLTKFALFGTVLGLILMASLAFQAIRQRQIAEIGEINALVSSATSSFLLNQQLQALTTILKSAQKLAALDIEPMQNQEIDKAQTFRNTYEALQLIVYNIRERYRFSGINRDSPFYTAKFSPDGKMMALGGFDGSVYLLDSNGKLLRTMTGFQAKEIRGLSFSADGKRIASSGQGGIVRIWNVDNGKLIREIQAHTSDIFRVDFHPDGKRLLTGSKDGLVKVWDSDRAVELLTINPQDNLQDNQVPVKPTSFVARQAAAIQDTSFSPDGKMIVTAKNNMIALWDLQGNQLAAAIAHQSIIYMVRFNPQGNQLVSTGGDKSVKLWQIPNQILTEISQSPILNPQSPIPQLEQIQIFEGNTADVLSVNFSREGNRIAFGTQDNAIGIFNLNGTIDTMIGAHTDAVFDVTFSPDDQYLLSASKDRTARLWYGETAMLKTIYAHQNPVWAVSFAPNGKMFASGSVDKNVFIWNIDGTRRMSLLGHRDTVYGVNFSSDGKYLISASEDRTAKVWDSNKGELLHTLDIHGSGLVNAMLSPDRQILATLGTDNKIKLWRWNQTNNPPLIHELSAHRKSVWSIAFSPDSRFLVSTGNDETLQIWDVATGKGRTITKAHKNGGLAVAYSPDGKLIASSGKDGWIKIWDAATGTIRQEIMVNSEAMWIYGIAFSPDGAAIAAGNADKSIKIYDINNGQILKTLTGHNAEVHAIAFSPDSQNLVSVSRDNSIKIWNAETLNFSELVARGCQMLKAHTANSPHPDRDKICR